MKRSNTPHVPTTRATHANKRDHIYGNTAKVPRFANSQEHHALGRAWNTRNLCLAINNVNWKRNKSSHMSGKYRALHQDFVANPRAKGSSATVKCLLSAGRTRLLRRNRRTECLSPGSNVMNQSSHALSNATTYLFRRQRKYLADVQCKLCGFRANILRNA